MPSSGVTIASTNRPPDCPHQIIMTSLDTALPGIDVEQHHTHEEVHYFPAIERVTDQKGIMDSEAKEHSSFHEGLKSFKNYLTSLKMPTDFRPIKLLSIMDTFSQPLYSHLASEPQAILALSRFASPERQFDLLKIEHEEGKKAVTLDFAFNVLPIFMNNMETVEFEGGMWRNHPEIPSIVRWIMKVLIPLWNGRQWRFLACDSQGRRKYLVA
ncbi:hypothetical protein ONS95_007768 [Cadophora gregata]|uniref:uncharacterized protein n=1 Tax=Cadophora gregata TaxID=51156 RepID=UPI0026DB4FE1|nr:uncharacterized protein ONS95_007768 [Cadophora gregata]KAK0118896.1 hypothetical protein ONS96_011973 [Cadophora gregata f. sp. sojae]KAK0126150.1 hypothetical protein ONS95_007768 [Cadophora gregata]